jgi:hypothetical protein
MNMRVVKSSRLSLYISFVVLVAIIGSSWWLGVQSRSNIYEATAEEVKQLLSTTLAIEDSFNKMGDSDRIFTEYMLSLRSLEKSCHTISIHNQDAGKALLPSEKQIQMDQSNELCKDLVKLTVGSYRLYSSIGTLLEADPTPLRYKYLPPFHSMVRANHERQANEALKRLNENPDDTFPSGAQAELRILLDSIKSSEKLAYLPSLATFQSRILGERQQYWTAYADLPALKNSLQAQVDNYCKTADLVDCSVSN